MTQTRISTPHQSCDSRRLFAKRILDATLTEGAACGLWISGPVPGSGDAETGLGAVEDQRNDQILLVIEMPPQLAQQCVVG